MKYNSRHRCFVLLSVLLAIAFLGSACNDNISAMQFHPPSSPSIRRFDLPPTRGSEISWVI